MRAQEEKMRLPGVRAFRPPPITPTLFANIVDGRTAGGESAEGISQIISEMTSVMAATSSTDGTREITKDDILEAQNESIYESEDPKINPIEETLKMMTDATTHPNGAILSFDDCSDIVEEAYDVALIEGVSDTAWLARFVLKIVEQ